MIGKSLTDEFKVQKLGNLVNIKTGKLDANASSENGEYPFFTCSITPLRIDSYSYDCECVLVAGNGDLNVKYYNGRFDAYQRTYIIESKDKLYLDTKYLYYFMSKYIDILRDQSIGGVIKYIKLGNLTEAEIPVPPLETQKKIVEILERAGKALEKKKEAIKLLDELVKSRFIEMFGDLSKNNKGWAEVELSKVCNVIHRYPTFYGMDYIEEGTPVIRIGNILNDGILEDNMENYVFVYDGVNKDFPLTTIELGDILMAVRGDGSAAKRIGIVKTEKLIGANISPNLLRIKAKKSIANNVYLFWYLISDVGQRRLDAYVNKTAKKNIAAKDIKKVITAVPPIELQNQFADFVKQIDKLKFKMEESLEELENNFNSLMQRTFKGESKI